MPQLFCHFLVYYVQNNRKYQKEMEAFFYMRNGQMPFTIVAFYVIVNAKFLLCDLLHFMYTESPGII